MINIFLSIVTWICNELGFILDKIYSIWVSLTLKDNHMWNNGIIKQSDLSIYPVHITIIKNVKESLIKNLNCSKSISKVFIINIQFKDMVTKFY